jgi:hypothetical protein
MPGTPFNARRSDARPGRLSIAVPDAPPAPLLGSTGTTTLVLAALLVALGVAMVVTTVWLVRATRTDSHALGPLEVMGDRRWHHADPDRRTRSLDAARPPGALPPAPMLDTDPEPAPAVVANGEPSEQEPASAAHGSAEELAVVANGEPSEQEAASTAHGSAGAEDPQPAETA